MIYTVPSPSTGMSTQLKSWDPRSSTQILNSRRFLLGLNGAPVIRWTQQDAQVAERIVRREWERRLGQQLVDTEVGTWMVQSLVQAAANEICGTWNARPTTDANLQGVAWDWAGWARLARWTAFLSPEHFLEFLRDVNDSRCDRYAAYVADSIIGGGLFAAIDSDPWYQEPFIWQLPAQGPYTATFTTAPVGYAGTWSAPPDALPPPTVAQAIPGDTPIPPADLPPGTDLPPLPPGGEPPQLPPGDPGGLAPVGYSDTSKTKSPDKEPAEWWKVAFGAAMGVAGLLFVGATLWGTPSHRENPTEAQLKRRRREAQERERMNRWLAEDYERKRAKGVAHEYYGRHEDETIPWDERRRHG